MAAINVWNRGTTGSLKPVPDAAHAFDIAGPKARLCASEAGGLEVVHESTVLQISVYTLVAPEPDHPRANADDELYIVLEGRGWLDVEGEQLELQEGRAVFVPARASHQFIAYEHLSVLEVLARKYDARDDATA